MESNKAQNILDFINNNVDKEYRLYVINNSDTINNYILGAHRHYHDKDMCSLKSTFIHVHQTTYEGTTFKIKKNEDEGHIIQLSAEGWGQKDWYLNTFKDEEDDEDVKVIVSKNKSFSWNIIPRGEYFDITEAET
jgi:hypothetical protein